MVKGEAFRQAYPRTKQNKTKIKKNGHHAHTTDIPKDIPILKIENAAQE